MKNQTLILVAAIGIALFFLLGKKTSKQSGSSAPAVAQSTSSPGSLIPQSQAANGKQRTDNSMAYVAAGVGILGTLAKLFGKGGGGGGSGFKPSSTSTGTSNGARPSGSNQQQNTDNISSEYPSSFGDNAQTISEMQLADTTPGGGEPQSAQDFYSMYGDAVGQSWDNSGAFGSGGDYTGD